MFGNSLGFGWNYGLVEYLGLRIKLVLAVVFYWFLKCLSNPELVSFNCLQELTKSEAVERRGAKDLVKY